MVYHKAVQALKNEQKNTETNKKVFENIINVPITLYLEEKRRPIMERLITQQKLHIETVV